MEKIQRIYQSWSWEITTIALGGSVMTFLIAFAKASTDHRIPRPLTFGTFYVVICLVGFVLAYYLLWPRVLPWFYEDKVKEARKLPSKTKSASGTHAAFPAPRGAAVQVDESSSTESGTLRLAPRRSPQVGPSDFDQKWLPMARSIRDHLSSIVDARNMRDEYLLSGEQELRLIHTIPESDSALEKFVNIEVKLIAKQTGHEIESLLTAQVSALKIILTEGNGFSANILPNPTNHYEFKMEGPQKTVEAYNDMVRIIAGHPIRHL